MGKKYAEKCDFCSNKFHGTYHYDDVNKTFLCCKHLHQMQRHGRIFDRTRFDPNKIVSKKDYCELCLYSGQGDQYEECRAKIDKDVASKVSHYKWCAVKKGKVYYIKTDIRTGSKRETLYLASLIFGEKKGFQIDHRNGDTLDNRRQNLRFCTQQQNLMNKSKSRGIWWNKKRKVWEAYINVNGKKKNLGFYDNEQIALTVRHNAEKKYYGEFAPVRI